MVSALYNLALCARYEERQNDDLTKHPLLVTNRPPHPRLLVGIYLSSTNHDLIFGESYGPGASPRLDIVLMKGGEGRRRLCLFR